MFQVNGIVINPVWSVDLLGVKIDGKLIFDKHVSNHCIKASDQFNAMYRLMNQKGKETIINSFVYSNVN